MALSAMLRKSGDIKYDPKHKGYLYQLEAVEAIKGLSYSAVFHEQGLGKTKIAIDLALEWLREDQVDSVLVVTKRSLIENWREEVQSHAFLTPRVLDQNRSSSFFSMNSPARFYVAHYEVIKSDERRFALFLKTRRVAAILDESQKIKNPDADLTKAFHRLAPCFVRRVIMTGTPVANRPFDLWAQVYFLDQGASLGTDFDSFQRSLDLSNDMWNNERKRERFESTLAGLFEKISAFSVRETKDSAGIELPDKRIENILIEPEARQLQLYEKFRTELRAEVFRDGALVEDDAEDILKRLLRLVQIASNPHLVDRSYDGVPAKLPKLLELVEHALSLGSKVIVWTNFVENAKWLSRELEKFGSVAVYGSLPIDERNEAINLFKSDSSCRILIATPGAAKEGLTLTVANHAIFFDRSFSLDDYLQAQDRIHRISQTQTCYIWNLLCSGTVDEWVDMLLTAKRLAAQLAQSDIDREEYQRLANYDFGRVIRDILGLGER
jgi:SNF2 family DNA or RNA helicase